MFDPRWKLVALSTVSVLCCASGCASGALEGGAGEELDAGATVDGASPVPRDSATVSGDATSGFDTGVATDGAVIPPDDGALHIAQVYGNGTSIMGGWGAGMTLGVKVTDGAGRPASGVAIVWARPTPSFASFPAAGASPSFTVTTDESGWSIAGINAPNPTTAFVESVLTATMSGPKGEERSELLVLTTNNGESSGPAGQQAFAGKDNPNHAALGPYAVGSTTPGALTFTVVCNNATRCFGQPLKNVSVRLNLPDAATPSGKSDPRLDAPVECVRVEPLSDDKGVITCDLHVKRAFSGIIRASVGQFVEFEYTLTTK